MRNTTCLVRVDYFPCRNVPAITEINSGSTPVTSRLAYIAVGEFGAPIYAPWD